MGWLYRGRAYQCAAALWLLCIAAPRPAHADDDLSALHGSLSPLAREADDLAATPLSANVFQETDSLPDQIRRAEVLYGMREPGAAAALFALVNNPAAGSAPNFRQYVFELGDALYDLGADLGARHYLEDVIAHHDTAMMIPAAVRIIDIADRTESWTGLDETLNALRVNGALPVELALRRIRSVLRQGTPERAQDLVRDISQDHPLYAKCAYLGAIGELEAGHVDASMELLNRIGALGDSYQDAAQVRDLAALSLGRIYLEQGALDEARAAYEQVSKTGPYALETLFESTWTAVGAAANASDDRTRRAYYDVAINSMMHLLEDPKESFLRPEARLLIANIYIKLGRYEQAANLFGQVLSTWRPQYRELVELGDMTADPTHLFEMSDLRPAQVGLAPLAAEYASSSGLLQRGLALARSVQATATWMGDIERIMERLTAVSESPHRAAYIPEVAGLHARHLALQNTLVRLAGQYIEAEIALVRDHLGAKQTTDLGVLEHQVESLRDSVIALPHTPDEYDARLLSLSDRVRVVERDILGSRAALQEVDKELTQLVKVAKEQASHFDSDEAAAVQDRLLFEGRVRDALRVQQAALHNSTQAERSLFARSQDELTAEDGVRERYEKVLAKQRDIVAAIPNNVLTPEQVATRTAIQQDMASVVAYRTKADAFLNHLNGLVAERVQAYRANITAQANLVKEYHQALTQLQQASRQTVRDIAQKALERVESKYDDIVLRADVGIVDIVWQTKEEKSRAIGQQIGDQHDSLQALDNEFKEVTPRDD